MVSPLHSINLRSKIIAAMLFAAALTGLTQAWLGNQNVKESFSGNLDQQLSSVAHLTAESVENYLDNASDIVRSLSTNPTVVFAFTRFKGAFASLSDRAFRKQQRAELYDYYAKDFAPALVESINARPVVEALLPASSLARVLQYHYIANNPAPTGRKAELDKAEDGSAYSDIHARFHPALRDLRDDFDLVDLFLIEPDGDVVYTTLKEVDYMTNLISDAFSDSGLARAFVAARDDRATRPVILQDFSFYLPSLGVPSIFLATPVYSKEQFLGVVAIQLSSDAFNDTVVPEGDRQAMGLGETGDIFIVGNDSTLRTTSRGFVEDRERFLAGLGRDRIGSETIAKVEAFGTPIKLVGAPNRLGDQGGSRDAITFSQVIDFEGEDARAAVVSIDFPGIDWSVVAEMSISEATRPVAAFQRVMMIALATTVTLTTIGAMILARALNKPLHSLGQRLSRAANGDLETPVADASGRDDTIGELSAAAQSLVDNVRERLQNAEHARAQTEGVLSRFLPETIVRMITERERDSDANFDDLIREVPQATFVLGRLTGYREQFAAQSPREALIRLEELVEAIDVAAERHGVEKIRSVGDTYFAASGLSTPHIDQHTRTLAFARDMREVVERFGREQSDSFPLEACIGIASGEAVTGVIGRDKLDYDVRGVSVSTVESLCAKASPGEILVTAELATALAGTASFVASDKDAMRLLPGDEPTGNAA